MFNYNKKNDIIDKIKKVSVVFLVLVICWSLTSSITAAYDYTWDEIPLDSGFSQIIDGNAIALDDVEEFYEVPVGEPLILEYEIPQLQKTKILMLYSKDVEVEIFVDDENIYSFAMEDGFEFLQTPGNKWNYVELSPESSGAILRLELTSNFENRFDYTLENMYLAYPQDVTTIILQNDGLQMLMTIVLLAMSLFAYSNAFIWTRPSSRKYFWRLANLYFATSLWLGAMCGVSDYLIHKPVFSYVISVVMAVFIPVTVYELARVVYQGKNKIADILGFTVWANFIVQMIMQFVFGVSILSMLPILYAVYAVCAFFFAVLIIHNMFSKNKDGNFALTSMLILCVGGLGEIVVLLVAPERVELIGAASILGMVVYLVVNQFHIAYRESRVDIKKQKLEQDYNYLQGTTLTLQIKAHFFFNTLNTISALCKVDPKEADRGILLFASYMRSYMKLINRGENISFEEELEIVEATLAIEKLRFPDGFVYEFDIEFEDFKIPPLSIQPLVENSLAHGVRNLDGEGKIVISTKCLDDYVEVIVEDNGVGFDTSILENKQSVGLANLEKRVELMANGTVEIKSVVGKGTKTTLRIPMAK